MKPVYFPFTFMPDPVVEAVSACFGQVVVYQPSGQNVPEQMQKWTEGGTLDIRVPIKEDEERLDSVLKDYRDWLNLHQGGEIAFLKTLKDAIPYFDETSTSKIRADIRKKVEGSRSDKEPAIEKNDLLLQARLFLLAAQELDVQNFSIFREIRQFEEMEQDLFKNLKGEIEDSHVRSLGNNALMTDDPGACMAPERMAAWARLMLSDQMENSDTISGLYITSSRTVFEYLTDNVPGVQMALDFDSIPVYRKRIEAVINWQDRLLEHLTRLAQNPWPPPKDADMESCIDKPCDRSVSLELYIVPGEEPLEFFSRFITKKPLQPHSEDTEKRLKNTLVGLIKF